EIVAARERSIQNPAGRFRLRRIRQELGLSHRRGDVEEMARRHRHAHDRRHWQDAVHDGGTADPHFRKRQMGQLISDFRFPIFDVAKRARSQGATRFCMGAAWRGVRDGSEKFERVLKIVREVSQLGMEVCVTLGEIGPVEARKLKTAGVTAYNHNIDTSPQFYPQIVSTHTFNDRLNTIAAVQESGMSVCCGGIIGMGESENDRLRMLEVLSNLDPPPESVPINCLMAMPGTPLAGQPPVNIFELVRLIAVARIALPKARVRLAAGRTRISREGQ